jgi:hypothetical protein
VGAVDGVVAGGCAEELGEGGLVMEKLAKILALVERHESLIALILLPVIAFFLSQYFAGRADRQASLERELERQLARDLQAAATYQSSIEILRDDMADFLSLLMEWRFSKIDSSWPARSKLNRILLRLDDENENTKKFEDLAEEALKALNHEAFYSMYQPLFKLCGIIIAENWTKMNSMVLPKRGAGQ